MKTPTTDDIIDLQALILNDNELNIYGHILYQLYATELSPACITYVDGVRKIEYPNTPEIAFMQQKTRDRMKEIEIKFWTERGFIKPEEK